MLMLIDKPSYDGDLFPVVLHGVSEKFGYSNFDHPDIVPRGQSDCRSQSEPLPQMHAHVDLEDEAPAEPRSDNGAAI